MATFKHELQRYPRPRSSAIRQHLDRWFGAVDTEHIWTKVSKAAGANLTAHEFIQFVVRSRATAAGLSARLEGNARDRAHVLAWHRPRIKKAMASVKMTLSEIAEALEDAAFEMRQIEQYSTLELSDYPTGSISRKDQGGSQARRAFCLFVYDFFQERCNKLMDAEVAGLVDIAFPRRRGKITSIDEVREYRRLRPPKRSDGGFEAQKLN